MKSNGIKTTIRFKERDDHASFEKQGTLGHRNVCISPQRDVVACRGNEQENGYLGFRE